jgi:hypothetical protein
MYRSLLPLLAAAPLLAAPGAKDKGPVLYHPVQEGAKRVVETRTGDRVLEATETVTKVEANGGTYRVSVERAQGGRTVMGEFEVSEKGVVRLAGVGKGQPVPLLKLPAKAGDTWGTEGAGPTTTYTMGAEEEVEVPAGKFKALRVDAESQLGGQTRKATAWYAPGVGLVKSVATTPTGFETTSVLKSFTPGK